MHGMTARHSRRFLSAAMRISPAANTLRFRRAHMRASMEAQRVAFVADWTMLGVFPTTAAADPAVFAVKAFPVVPLSALHTTVLPERNLALLILTRVANALLLIAVAAYENTHLIGMSIEFVPAVTGRIVALLAAHNFSAAWSDHVALTCVVGTPNRDISIVR